MAVVAPRGPRAQLRRPRHEVAPPMEADRTHLRTGSGRGASPTVAGGELKPTLKLKRSVVIERFAELVAETYAR